MAKFNATKTPKPSASRAASSVVKTAKKRATTAEGGPGWTRKPKSELFLLGVSNMVGEGTFYEAAPDRDKRYADLVKKLATNGDFEWLAGYLRWLRNDANMRSAPIVGAVEAVRARLNAKLYTGNRQLVESVLQRADEPGEMLAYYHSTHGRSVPHPIKNGINDAVRRLYNERSLLKYDTDSHGYRFGDVIELCRPQADEGKPWQNDLFKFAIDRRHKRDEEIPTTLPVIAARQLLARTPIEKRADRLNSDDMKSAGMTWEATAGWLQSEMDAKAWEAMIPSMGYMALLRNLRNFDEKGVSNDCAKAVAARLADPREVAKSRQLPMRFLSAYREARDDRWTTAIGEALEHSLANVPELPGNSLILVDRSGSMFSPFSKHSTLTAADASAVFAVSLARRAEKMDLIEYGTDSGGVSYKQGESVLKVISRFQHLGGTRTKQAVDRWYNGHDRVVLLTDEQAWNYKGDAGVFGAVPASIPCYTWNLGGYRVASSPSGTENRHTFGGLSDAAFSMIPLIEAGMNADWPWLNE